MADGTVGFDAQRTAAPGEKVDFSLRDGALVIAARPDAPTTLSFLDKGMPRPDFEFAAATSIGRLLDRPSLNRSYNILTGPARQDPEALLDDRRANLKVATAEIAMHLDTAWRAGLFRSLDNLMTAEDWDFSDKLPDLASYRTFLRMIIYLGGTFGPIARPMLGATPAGNIVAGWVAGRDRLTIECRPDDTVVWNLTIWGDAREAAAGEANSRRLPDVLSPYGPERWLSGARR